MTVLYCQCDLFDAPEFLEGLDPEEQHEVLSDYLAAAGKAVARLGGTVVQAAGRELLVCLGYPVSYEDAARRAVLTGLAIRDAVAELAGRLPPMPGAGLSVRAGAHTGPVVAEPTGAGGGEGLALAGEAPTSPSAWSRRRARTRSSSARRRTGSPGASSCARAWGSGRSRVWRGRSSCTGCCMRATSAARSKPPNWPA